MLPETFLTRLVSGSMVRTIVPRICGFDILGGGLDVARDFPHQTSERLHGENHCAADLRLPRWREVRAGLLPASAVHQAPVPSAGRRWAEQ